MPNDGPAKTLREDFYAFLNNSTGKITIILAFIAALFNIISLIQNNKKITLLALTFLIVIVTGTICMFSLVIYQKKKVETSPLVAALGEPISLVTPYYPTMVRRISLAVLILLPLAAAFFIGWLVSNPSSETTILISKIGDSSCDKYEIAEEIDDALKELKQQRLFFKIDRVPQRVMSDEEDAKVREEHSAIISISGSCFMDSDKIRGVIYFNSDIASLKDTIRYSELSPTKDIPVITNEISYIIALKIGLKLFQEKKFEESVSLFDKAEELLQKSKKPEGYESGYESKAGNLYYYRGRAYFDWGKQKEALSDFKTALVFKHQKDADMYYRLGLCHLNLISLNNEDKKIPVCAFGQFQKALTREGNNEEYTSKYNVALNKVCTKEDIEKNINCPQIRLEEYDEQFCEQSNIRQ